MLTNEKVILRIFEPADIEPVYILVMGTIDKSYTGVYPEEAIRFFKQYHCKENIYDDYLNGYTIIAELEREIVGTGTLLGANIRRVFVNKCYQGHGLGKLIMKKLENRASKEGLKAVDLSASLTAKRFYDSLGYVTQAEKYIDVGKDIKLIYYQMLKDL